MTNDFFDKNKRKILYGTLSTVKLVRMVSMWKYRGATRYRYRTFKVSTDGRPEQMILRDIISRRMSDACFTYGTKVRTEVSVGDYPVQASKFVKIHGSKLLLPSLRAGSETIFVVANLRGFERPRPIHGSYSGSVRKVHGIIAVSCNKSNE